METNNYVGGGGAAVTRTKKKVKTGGISLGEELLEDNIYSGSSALDWVKKSRTLAEKEKEALEVAKARRQFEEEENEMLRLQRASDGHDLAGKKVRHDIDQFNTGETKILILKDRSILDKQLNIVEDEDELINVELLEKDKLQLKKARTRTNKLPGYDPFREDIVMDETGDTLLLPQYQEEKKERDGFTLNDKGSVIIPQEARFNEPDNKRPAQAYNLMDGLPTIERDYFTAEELEAKFKKRKRKSKKNVESIVPVKKEEESSPTKDKKRPKEESVVNNDAIMTNKNNQHSNKRRKLNNGETKYDFLDENITEEWRGQRDEAMQALRKEQQREEARMERQQHYQMAIHRNTQMMLAKAAEEQELNYLFDDEGEGRDTETERALERASLLERKAQSTEDATRRLVAKINEVKESESKKEIKEEKFTPSIEESIEDKSDGNGLLFTQAMQFSHGLKDAVGEMEEDVEQMRRRKFGTGEHVGIGLATGINNNVNDKNEDMPAVIDPKTGLPVSRSRHHLDHLLELRESTNNLSGVWVAPEENNIGKESGKNIATATTTSSQQQQQQQSPSGIVKEGVSSNDFVLLESEPLVARSIADTLKHVRRRGFMDDEEFDELAGGKIQQFRPVDIEKKGKKEHLGWDVNRVLKWLREIGLVRYQDSFRNKRVDGRVLDSITTEFGCRVLNMREGDCHNLLQALGELKGDPAPDIHLSYLDDAGRPMTAKEAFRKLSHRFHGKKPGKRKQEKRIKKREEEFIRKNRHGVDTPLGTLEKLKQATEYTGKPFIVLNGRETTKMAQTIDYSDERYDAKRRL